MTLAINISPGHSFGGPKIYPDVIRYYVDATGGDDDKDGRSEAQAWQTIAKVNATTFYPSEQILFKAGETFAGKLTPTDSGVAGNPIVYGSYGSGARPIIDGTADEAFSILHGEAAFLRMEHLDLAGCADGAGKCAVRCYTHDVYWYDCIFRDADSSNWSIGYGGDSAGTVSTYNHTLDSCQVYNNKNSGITMGTITGAQHNSQIINCIIHDNGSNPWYDHGIYSGTGVLVEGCISYNNTFGAGIKCNCMGHHEYGQPSLFRNNICYGNKVGFVIDNIDSIVYNNLTYNNLFNEIGISADTAGGLIYFNTFINSVGNCIRIEPGAAGATLKNNLFIQDYLVHNTWIFTPPSGETVQSIAENNTWDYNIYYHDSQAYLFWDTVARTWANWQGWGAEPNGTHILSAPNFVSNYSDLHPADGGNLKGLGVAITGYELDKDGHTRADPPTPGCYEESA